MGLSGPLGKFRGPWQWPRHPDAAVLYDQLANQIVHLPHAKIEPVLDQQVR